MQEGDVVHRRKVDEELMRHLQPLAQPASLGRGRALGFGEPQAFLQADEFELPPGRGWDGHRSGLRGDA